MSRQNQNRLKGTVNLSSSVAAIVGAIAIIVANFELEINAETQAAIVTLVVAVVGLFGFQGVQKAKRESDDGV